MAGIQMFLYQMHIYLREKCGKRSSSMTNVDAFKVDLKDLNSIPCINSFCHISMKYILHHMK